MKKNIFFILSIITISIGTFYLYFIFRYKIDPLTFFTVVKPTINSVREESSSNDLKKSANKSAVNKRDNTQTSNKRGDRWEEGLQIKDVSVLKNENGRVTIKYIEYDPKNPHNKQLKFIDSVTKTIGNKRTTDTIVTSDLKSNENTIKYSTRSQEEQLVDGRPGRTIIKDWRTARDGTTLTTYTTTKEITYSDDGKWVPTKIDQKDEKEEYVNGVKTILETNNAIVDGIIQTPNMPSPTPQPPSPQIRDDCSVKNGGGNNISYCQNGKRELCDTRFYIFKIKDNSCTARR